MGLYKELEKEQNEIEEVKKEILVKEAEIILREAKGMEIHPDERISIQLVKKALYRRFGKLTNDNGRGVWGSMMDV